MACPFNETIGAAFGVVAAHARAARVDRAPQSGTIQRIAPTIVTTTHYRAAPRIDFNESVRNVIARHQNDLQPAAAGGAVIAANRSIDTHGAL